jgi:hypothetical protein
MKRNGLEENGTTYTPVANKGKVIAPITYNNTTYLPVRAVADALKVLVTFDSVNNQVVLGTGSIVETIKDSLTPIQFNTSQKTDIINAFANFQGFETVYAPTQMINGDVFEKVVSSDDGVSFLFKHMKVSISPRDYSYEYKGDTVKLSNGTEAKWYSPSSDSLFLTYKLADRHVTISSPNKTMSKAHLEKVALHVLKWNK